MTTREIQQALSAPFAPDKIGWKAQSVKNNRALAVAYCDARDVMDRLDAVLGVENWEDSYDLAPDGSVVCQLRVKIGESWVVKSDVGSQSEQPDSGDRLKAAFSDALKRAAVKFGIGRYLYSLPAQWCDYDPVKKQLVGTPQLPAWALPGKSAPVPKPAPAAPPPPKSAPMPTQRWDIFDGDNPDFNKTTAEVQAIIDGGADPAKLQVKPAGSPPGTGKPATAHGFKRREEPVPV